MDESFSVKTMSRIHKMTSGSFNYGAETWELCQEEVQALLTGKTLAREINGGEYTCFLVIGDTK